MPIVMLRVFLDLRCFVEMESDRKLFDLLCPKWSKGMLGWHLSGSITLLLNPFAKVVPDYRLTVSWSLPPIPPAIPQAPTTGDAQSDDSTRVQCNGCSASAAGPVRSRPTRPRTVCDHPSQSRPPSQLTPSSRHATCFTSSASPNCPPTARDVVPLLSTRIVEVRGVRWGTAASQRSASGQGRFDVSGSVVTQPPSSRLANGQSAVAASRLVAGSGWPLQRPHATAPFALTMRAA
jgi:hypothetical protein